MAIKRVQKRAPIKVTLRSYNVGFGDCFMLSFHYVRASKHVLIDFGSTELPDGRLPGNHMLRIANQIKNDCGGKLTAVVATHRHKDHISGFATANGKGPGDVIKSLSPELVIQPWTEDPDAERDATRANGARSERAANKSLYLRSLKDMNRFAGFVQIASRRLRGSHLAQIREQLAFLGDDNELANRSAVLNLMNMASKKVYVCYGDRPGLGALLPGVKCDVLGPPNLEQTSSISKQRSRDAGEFWHLRSSFWAQKAQLDRTAAEYSAPLFPKEVLKNFPWDVRWYRYRAQREQGHSLLSIVRSLDRQMNNTSLILLFQVGKTLMLFPGDAQFENWMYALSRPGVAKRLSKVNIYKVGHHGSLNATPRSLWDRFASKGEPNKKKRLIAFLSTKDEVHGHAADNTEVPRRSLVTALEKYTTLRDTRLVQRDKLCIEETIAISGE